MGRWFGEVLVELEQVVASTRSILFRTEPGIITFIDDLKFMIEKPIITTIFIRPMKMEDIRQVQSIDRMSFSTPWPEHAYRYELLENPASLLWVAEAHLNNGELKVVGIIVVWLILDEAHIATLAVHPDFREQGIGSQLLATALKKSIQKGVNQSALEVRAKNEVAQNLYRRFGFEIVGKRRHYYQDNHEDAVLMSLYGMGNGYLLWLEENFSFDE